MSGAAAGARRRRKRKGPDRFGFDEKRSATTASAAAVDADGDEPMHDIGGGGGGGGGGIGMGDGSDERAAKRHATAPVSVEHFPTAAEIAVVLNGLNTGAEVATGLLPELNAVIAAYAFVPVRWSVCDDDALIAPAQLSSDSGTAKTVDFGRDPFRGAKSTVPLSECARRGLRLRVAFGLAASPSGVEILSVQWGVLLVGARMNTAAKPNAVWILQKAGSVYSEETVDLTFGLAINGTADAAAAAAAAAAVGGAADCAAVTVTIGGDPIAHTLCAASPIGRLAVRGHTAAVTILSD
jgi:hypothetical protein